jgi:hypothetical protein
VVARFRRAEKKTLLAGSEGQMAVDSDPVTEERK